MIQKRLKTELHKIGMRELIPPHVIEAVFSSQFEFTRIALQEGDKDDIDSFKCVGIKYFGKFAPFKNKIKRMKKIRDDRKNRKS